MPPVVSALLALVSSLWRSRWALRLQVLALQYQVAVYKQTVRRPRLSPTDRVFWSWLSCLFENHRYHVKAVLLRARRQKLTLAQA